jgi:hypothetical protein
MTKLQNYKVLILIALAVCIAVTAILILSADGKQEGAFIYQMF